MDDPRIFKVSGATAVVWLSAIAWFAVAIVVATLWIVNLNGAQVPSPEMMVWLGVVVAVGVIGVANRPFKLRQKFWPQLENSCHTAQRELQEIRRLIEDVRRDQVAVRGAVVAEQSHKQVIDHGLDLGLRAYITEQVRCEISAYLTRVDGWTPELEAELREAISRDPGDSTSEQGILW